MSGFEMAGFLASLSDTVRPGTQRPLVVHASELEPLPANEVHNPSELAIAGALPTSTFEIFRQRRQESLRLAKEEAARKAEEDRMMNEWMIRDAKKTLGNPSSSEKQRQQAEEVLALFPQTESEQ